MFLKRDMSCGRDMFVNSLVKDEACAQTRQEFISYRNRMK